MTIVVLEPGVQATVQAAARQGLRGAGVPSSGPADPLSMALANRLVGRPAAAACVEITYGPALFRFEADMQIGLAGASADVRVNGAAQAVHATLAVSAGDELSLGLASAGARIYLAVSGRLLADEFLGSASTYLPAGLAGHEGRELRRQDRLEVIAGAPVPAVKTPDDLRLPPASSYALRAVAGPDLADDTNSLTHHAFQVSPRISRMGAELLGPFPAPENAASRPSSAVFPGALQVTPQGSGFLLLADGQTTGGYPHLLQVIRADRHLMGQLKPGNTVRFLLRTQGEAEAALRAKQALLERWLPDFQL